MIDFFWGGIGKMEKNMVKYTSPVGTNNVREWKEGKYDSQVTEYLSSRWKYVVEMERRKTLWHHNFR